MSDPYTSGRYAEANPDWHAADAPHKARALAAVIRDAGLRPASVVDVGCGAGGVLRALAAALGPGWPGTTWEGWDVAPEAVARARAGGEGGPTFRVGDFVADGERAGLVLCVDVIEHLPDDRAFLRALRPRGEAFLFRIPLDLSAWDVLRPTRVLEATRRYGHLHLYTRALALERLREAGFQVERAVYDRVPPPRDTRRRRWVDAARTALFARWPDRTVDLIGGWSLIVLARPDQPSSGR